MKHDIDYTDYCRACGASRIEITDGFITENCPGPCARLRTVEEVRVDYKTPQCIARMASELMEALSDYLAVVDKEILADLKAGRPLPVTRTAQRNVLASLYEPMIKWRFEVERIVRE